MGDSPPPVDVGVIPSGAEVTGTTGSTGAAAATGADVAGDGTAIGAEVTAGTDAASAVVAGDVMGQQAP
jgi:hypothetical protein